MLIYYSLKKVESTAVVGFSILIKNKLYFYRHLICPLPIVAMDNQQLEFSEIKLNKTVF